MASRFLGRTNEEWSEYLGVELPIKFTPYEKSIMAAVREAGLRDTLALLDQESDKRNRGALLMSQRTKHHTNIMDATKSLMDKRAAR